MKAVQSEGKRKHHNGTAKPLILRNSRPDRRRNQEFSNRISDVNTVAEHYQGKSDEEIVLLAADIDQLLPEAQEALRAEMRGRGLSAQNVEEVRAERELEARIEEKRQRISQLSRHRTWYGKRNRALLPNTQRERFTTTFFICFEYVPLVPVATYRIERLRSRWRDKVIILEKLPLDWEQVLRVWIATAGIALAVIWAFKLWFMFSTR
jgi:hypothetical protein